MSAYQKVSNNEDDEEAGLGAGCEMSSLHGDGEFVVKVLFKETRYEIRGLTPQSTINDLKVKVFLQSNVPEHLQRFIFQGKQLKPDTETLSNFHVASNANVHLFPIQVVAPTPAPSQSETLNMLHLMNPMNGNNGNLNANNNINYNNNINNNDNLSNNNNNINNGTIQAALDPRMQEVPQAVRFWSMILLALSVIELFDKFTLMSTGILGVSVLDSIVNLADTFCSVLGIYVAQLGLKSVRTGDMQTVNEYVKWLTICAAACIIMRVLWVVDLSFQMENLKKTNNKRLREEPPAVTDPNSKSDPDGTNTISREITEKDVTNFIIQASMIGAVIIYAWLKCVLRAYSFRTLVQRFRGIVNDMVGAAQ